MPLAAADGTLHTRRIQHEASTGAQACGAFALTSTFLWRARTSCPSAWNVLERFLPSVLELAVSFAERSVPLGRILAGAATRPFAP